MAATAGLVPAFLISAAVMAGGAATIWFKPTAGRAGRITGWGTPARRA